jgi:FkbM family methyltransferase
MIVVDLGCQTYGGEESIETLIARFQPALLYGFDPHPETVDEVRRIGATTVVTSRMAAWTYSDVVDFLADGSRSRVVAEGAGQLVRTFDLSAFIESLPRVPIILKMDVEGSEYRLLPDIKKNRVDGLLERILVEWHGTPLDLDLACPVERWPDA